MAINVVGLSTNRLTSVRHRVCHESHRFFVRHIDTRLFFARSLFSLSLSPSPLPFPFEIKRNTLSDTSVADTFPRDSRYDQFSRRERHVSRRAIAIVASNDHVPVTISVLVEGSTDRTDQTNRNPLTKGTSTVVSENVRYRADLCERRKLTINERVAVLTAAKRSEEKSGK